MLQENSSGKPLFPDNAIVFARPSPHMRPSTDYPSIGSPFEIDLKVINSELIEIPNYLSVDLNGPKYRTSFVYRLISGEGRHLNLEEQFLVSPKEKYMYLPSGYYTLLEDTELAPKGTPFVKQGDFISNDEIGVYIHKDRFEKIAKLFDRIKV